MISNVQGKRTILHQDRGCGVNYCFISFSLACGYALNLWRVNSATIITAANLFSRRSGCAKVGLVKVSKTRFLSCLGNLKKVHANVQCTLSCIFILFLRL